MGIGILAAENGSPAPDLGSAVESEPTRNMQEVEIRLPNHEGPSNRPLPDEETGSAVGQRAENMVNGAAGAGTQEQAERISQR